MLISMHGTCLELVVSSSVEACASIPSENKQCTAFSVQLGAELSLH